MSNPRTQAYLALYLGETYAELEVRECGAHRNASNTSALFKKNFFLPQTSLKTVLNQTQKHLNESNIDVVENYVVCRYFERLKTFRLGGSVVQVIAAGFENNYSVEHSSRMSLAAPSLIIAVEKNLSTELLQSELTRVKKINPDANKVVIQLDHKVFKAADIQLVKNFFTENNFKIFEGHENLDLKEIRRTLLNAGSEGTKEEIVSELKEFFPLATTSFWIRNQFTTAYENCDLYFSSDDFLATLLKESKKKNLLHFDIENWMSVGLEQKNLWDSPWGLIHRPHAETAALGLHPFTEILIDETHRLQFSKTQAASEPGPMVAGRGVKSLLIDAFFDKLKANEQISGLFPQIDQPQVQSKIDSQFKVLEKGQRLDAVALTKTDLQNSILDLIQFEIQKKFDSLSTCLVTGNLASMLTETPIKFSWTQEIFNRVTGQGKS